MTEKELSKYDYFVDLVLPLALENSFTYRVPAALVEYVKVGSRVIVPFKGSRLYTAIVERIHHTVPEHYEAKYILNILDEDVVVHQKNLDLWTWIANYYLCTKGEVMNAALPAALKLSSESRIKLHPEYNVDISNLGEKEYLIVEALQIQGGLSILEVQKILDQKSIMPLIKTMIQQGIVFIEEELEKKYKPKTVRCVTLNEEYKTPATLKNLFEVLEKKPKQLDLIQTFIRVQKSEANISVKYLLEESNTSISVLNTLIKNEVFIPYEHVVSRLNEELNTEVNQYQLNEEQEKAELLIEEAFKQKQPVMLHGITSSGKTMLYIRQIEKVLNEGKQVLILVPEIGLSAQLIERYKNFFKDHIGVYHSKYSDNERAELWNKVLHHSCNIVLGTRSSIFLPFSNLGLIIVDEEHDPSYKQHEPNPRYNARDVAIYLANKQSAKIILGSATPSIESYYNALQKKYALVELKERFGGVELPEMHIVSLQKERSPKAELNSCSKFLLDEIQLRIEKKEQVILFQNRRGFAPYIQCHVCGHSPHCINCDVSISYYKFKNELRCHYCGYNTSVIKVCPACGSGHLEMKGLGTEKIEDELKQIFPDARIARMDLDTTRSKHAYQELLDQLEDREIDILVGTQMVTKGLDFEHVTLVGIVQADHMLFMPDFRAHERAFQLIEQVSGRAGRRAKKGMVIIQSYQPEHPVLQMASRHDFEQFLLTQLTERKQFSYPPYVRLVELTIKNKEFALAQHAARKVQTELKKIIPEKCILGPETPAISKVRNLFIQKIMIKIDVEHGSLDKQKQYIKHCVQSIKMDKQFSRGVFLINVDPS